LYGLYNRSYGWIHVVCMFKRGPKAGIHLVCMFTQGHKAGIHFVCIVTRGPTAPIDGVCIFKRGPKAGIHFVCIVSWGPKAWIHFVCIFTRGPEAGKSNYDHSNINATIARDTQLLKDLHFRNFQKWQKPTVENPAAAPHTGPVESNARENQKEPWAGALSRKNFDFPKE
jgi:hypothetical protein